MKRLVFVRHAKAEQGGYDHDFSRSLTDRGMDDARQIAKELLNQNIRPQSIISSPANRALTTARLFAEEIGFEKKQIIEKKGLYFDYTTNDFIDMISEVSDSIQTLFVFGHNPFMFYMASNMCSNFSGDMPTCSTVVADFNVGSWKNLEPRQGILKLHLYPSQFK
jgi:phosphohistidine phosphatase